VPAGGGGVQLDPLCSAEKVSCNTEFPPESHAAKELTFPVRFRLLDLLRTRPPAFLYLALARCLKGELVGKQSFVS